MTSSRVGKPVVGVLLLAASTIALGLAPLILADSYSMIEHTTSESAGQGVDGAWLARAGFLLFGLAVLWIAHQSRNRWGQPGTAFHIVFALSMFGVAAFSLRSWIPDAPYDMTEDLLHSVFATAMGFAFAFGVLAVAVRRHQDGHHWRFLDGVAVLASVVLPIGMSVYVNVDGVLQRIMFLIAYIWYGIESLPQSAPIS